MDLAQEAGRRHDEAGDTEPALHRKLVDERLLDCVRRAIGVGHALDRRNAVAVDLSGRHEACHDGITIKLHGAGAALALGAPSLVPVSPASSRNQSSRVAEAACPPLTGAPLSIT